MPTPLKTIAKFPWKDQAREEQPHPLCEAEVIYGVLKEFIHLDEEAQRAKVVEMREALKAIDATKDGRMSLIEYLLWRYQVTVQAVEKAPQGGNSEELREAQEQFKAVERAMADTASKLEKQQAALAENNKKLKEVEAARKEADAAYAELKAAEDAVRAAEAELAAAVAELKRQEDEYAQKKATLAAKKELQLRLADLQDENLGVVARNKASNELDQLLAEDPLPLRRAKITQEAALRKVQKERKIAEEKTAVAQAKRDELRHKEEQLAHAKAQLEQAVADLEAAYDDLQRQMAVAEEKLEAAKQKGGVPLGQMWLMDRDLYEADKRLPTRRQRFNHSKPFEWAGPQ